MKREQRDSNAGAPETPLSLPCQAVPSIPVFFPRSWRSWVGLHLPCLPIVHIVTTSASPELHNHSRPSPSTSPPSPSPCRRQAASAGAAMEPADMDEDMPLRLPARGKEATLFGTIKPGDSAAAVAAGVASGNIMRQAADAETLDLPEVGTVFRLCRTFGNGSRPVHCRPQPLPLRAAAQCCCRQPLLLPLLRRPARSTCGSSRS